MFDVVIIPYSLRIPYAFPTHSLRAYSLAAKAIPKLMQEFVKYNRIAPEEIAKDVGYFTSFSLGVILLEF